jgi:hypothetical protein
MDPHAVSGDTGSSQELAEQARHRGDFTGARDLYLQAFRASPGSLNLRLDTAAACLACDDLRQAWQLLSEVKAQEVSGESRWRFHLCAAMVLQRLGRPEAAVAHYSFALSSPGIPQTSRCSAQRSASDLLLNALGDPVAAAGVYGTGFGPHEATSSEVPQAFLRNPEAWLSALVSAMYTGAVDSHRLVCGFQAFSAVHIASAGPGAQQPLPRQRSVASARRQRPRIGLISPLFCASPVGFLTLGTCEALGADADLVFFDRGGKPDWAQTRFRAASAEWIACKGADVERLRHLFAQADLDALVDLGGWMDLDALRAMAGRPVARQFKWVGGQSLTTGLQCFDGFWTDERQVPQGSRKLYSEPISRMSEGYVTYVSPPYRDLSAMTAHPPEPKPASPGAYALVSNPAKIGPRIRARLDEVKPTKLYLVDGRWRHSHARQTVHRWLGPWMERAEFVSPENHVEYLDVLSQLDATVIDTEPYSMGLTAIELRLLGKPVLARSRGTCSTMSERHCVAHLAARRFDHYRLQADEILSWCRA